MKLEDQVCSLELAKKLKELGVDQDSYFYWCRIRDLETDHVSIKSESQIENLENYYQVDKITSAFTVAEIGEMLPHFFDSWHEVGTWEYSIKLDRDGGMTFCAKTEADARAKTLIYLLEKGFIRNE